MGDKADAQTDEGRGSRRSIVAALIRIGEIYLSGK